LDESRNISSLETVLRFRTKSQLKRTYDVTNESNTNRRQFLEEQKQINANNSKNFLPEPSRYFRRKKRECLKDKNP
jgi:hypothetical protein